MSKVWEDSHGALWQGDVRACLAAMPAESVHCVVTSPPYWGLRAYGTEAQVWGGAPDCDHTLVEAPALPPMTGGSGAASAKQVTNAGSQFGNAWRENGERTNTTQRDHDGDGWADTRGKEAHRNGSTIRQSMGATCTRCGAWRGELGSEPLHDCAGWATGAPCGQCFICHLVKVFRAVRRVLRKDGTLFVNLGDSYFGGGARREAAYDISDRVPSGSLGRDCLCGSLCGVCRRAYQIGKAHSDGLPAPMLSASPSVTSPAHTESVSAHPPTWDSALPADHSVGATLDSEHAVDHAPAPLAASLESTPLQSSPRPLDECLRCANCGVSLAESHYDERAAQACICDGAAAGGSATLRATQGQRYGTVDKSLTDGASGSRNGGKASDSYLDYTATPHQLKPKDLCGIPWRFALAMQADGWWLRGDYIWSKPNPMPESVTDRCTRAHEYLFHFSKSAAYFWDQDAIRERGVTTADEALSKWASRRNGTGKGQQEGIYHAGVAPCVSDPHPLGRNKRSVWEVATHAYPEAHFATFPPALVKPCILAGCPEGETVLDPFAGSGTTLVVARALGRVGWGCELQPDYVQMSIKRLQQMVLL